MQVTIASPIPILLLRRLPSEIEIKKIHYKMDNKLKLNIIIKINRKAKW